MSLAVVPLTLKSEAKIVTNAAKRSMPAFAKVSRFEYAPVQKFKLRVSDPRTIAYVHFEKPFECSNLPVSGHIIPRIELLKSCCEVPEG